MRFFISIIFLLTGFSLVAQIKKVDRPNGGNINIKQPDPGFDKDSIKIKIKQFPATEYKIFNIEKDTISVDTTLTIRDAYRFNSLFRDDFDVLPFQNYGQPVTHLSFDITDHNLLPGFVASSKLTDDWRHEQTPFFKTPTPYSDLSYMNGISQGQVANAVFATNINKQLNVAAGYRGLSSLGLYKHSVSSSGRFFGSLNYQSKNNRYKLKFYYYTYEKTNEENGGLKDPAQFEQAGSDYSDRSRINVNLSDAENQTKKRRLYIDNAYGILKNKFILINQTTYRNRMYNFTQNTPAEILGDSTHTAGAVNDSVYLKEFDNLAGVKFNINNFKLQTGIRYIYQFYSFDSIKQLNGQTFPKFLEYQDISVDSKLKLHLGKLLLDGRLNIAVSNNLAGYYLKAKAKYKLPGNFKLTANLISISKRPDFKYILYQSAYDKYNWYHPDYDNVLTQKLQAGISHNKWGKLSVNQIIVNNYTYFGQDSLPRQDATGIKYAAIKYQKDFRYKKWGVSTDLQWQKVLDGQDLLSLPDFIVRGSLYFSNYYYQHNLYVQTGVTAKYFNAFYAKAYNPVLADFIVQNNQKIGAYPIIDYFVNFKIKRFRFYFKLEHLNAILKQEHPDYYAAPLQPYRDFSIRFGLRWIFFN